MSTKLLKYGTLFAILLIILIGLASFFHERAQKKEIEDFNAENFKKMNFTIEELYLFCDVAFGHEGQRLRKWETDIKVQIKNASQLDSKSIREVDSAIAVLAPLIAPLKIERVHSGGNLLVYRNVEEIPLTEIEGHDPNGAAVIGRRPNYSWNIESARIYDRNCSHSHTLMHEFEHALGLEHPSKTYSIYLTIGRSAIPQYFDSRKQWKALMNQPFYLSEQEKSVIRMLYSPEIKSGLRKDYFMQTMDLR